MSFLSAAFLAAIPLVGIPVVIHLLNRRRRTIIYWGATRFLQEAQTRRRSFLRLSDTLLMLLRALAVLLFILALARPQMERAAAGGSGPRDVTFLVDNSMSTALRDGNTTVYERIVDRTRDLIDDLSEADRFRILLASHPPRWIVTTPTAPSEAESFLALLGEAKPTRRAGNMMSALQAATALDDVDREALRQMVIVTDGQAHGWQADSAVFWRAARRQVENLTPPAVLRVVRVETPDGRRNLSVDSLTTSRTRAGVDDTLLATAWVQNTGTGRSPSFEVSFYVAGRFAGQETVESLDPGDKTSVRHELVLKDLGPVLLEARIGAGDDLPLDDEAAFLVEVVDRIPVLLVDGNFSARTLQTESGYLQAALGLPHGNSSNSRTSNSTTGGNNGSSRGVYQPTVVADYELEKGGVLDDLETYAAVVLADVPSLPDRVVERLEQFVENGGGLWIALGDRTDAPSFNASFHDRGLSPLSAGALQGQPTRGDNYQTVHIPNETHPALFLLADTERLDIPRARVYQYRALEDRTPETSVFFTTARGEPLVAEGSLGKGRVLVQAFPLTTEWTNLPTCQAFVVLAREWLGYLTEPGANRWNLGIGEPVAVHLPADDYNDEAVLTTPSGNKHELTAADVAGELSFVYRRTDDPGRYHLALETAAGRTREFQIHVARDTAESDLTPLPTEQVRQLEQLAGLEFDGDPLAAPLSADIQTARLEPLWTWFFGSLLLLFLVEVFIAAHLSRQRLDTNRARQAPEGAAS